MKALKTIAAGIACLSLIMALASCPSPTDPAAPPTAAASNNAFLSTLTVKVGDTTNDIGFQSTTYAYTYNVATDVESVTVNAVPADDEADFTGGGVVTLNAAGQSTEVQIVVTAANGTTKKTYTVTIKRAKEDASSDASLSALSLTTLSGIPITITPTFEAGTTSYEAAGIPYEYTSISMSATAADSSGASIIGTGTKLLDIGENTLYVIVTAADGVTQGNYKINVTRYGQESSRLSALTISDASFAFDPSANSFTVNVANNVSTVTINATPQYSGSTVSLDLDGDGTYETNSTNGSINLTEGVTSTVKVRVQSQYTKDYSYYTVTIRRAAAGASNDASLTSLFLDMSMPLSPGFDSLITSYTAPDTSDSYIYVKAEAIDGATIISGSGSRDLVVGHNDLHVVVMAANGMTTKTYTITVTRTAPPTITVTSPTAGSTISAGTTTFEGTISDPCGDVEELVVVVGTSMQTFSASAGPFSIQVDTSSLSNGEHTITFWATNCIASVVLSVSGSFDGHLAALAVTFSDGRPSVTGYLSVVNEGMMLLVNNVRLDGVTMPYELSIPRLADGSYSGYYVIFSEEPYASDDTAVSAAGAIPEFTIDGADESIGTVSLSAIN